MEVGVMVDEWKRRIEEKLNRDETARSKQLERDYEEEKRQEEATRAAEIAERARKWEEHNRVFRCHIGGCLNSCSSGPGRKLIQKGRRGGGNSGGNCSENIWGDDWSVSAHLTVCLECNRKTCADHLHLGICKDHS